MKSQPRNSVRYLFGVAAATGLLLAACGSAAPTSTVSFIVVPTRQPTAVVPEPTRVAVLPSQQPVTPTAVPKPEAAVAGPAAFGEAQTLGDFTITPIRVAQIETAGADLPKAGDVYLLVTLSVHNQSADRGIQFYPANLELAGEADHGEFRPVHLASVVGALAAQEIDPNGKLEGMVAFEVPANAIPPELEFRNVAGEAIRWDLPAAMGAEQRLGDLAVKPIETERLPWNPDPNLRSGSDTLVVDVTVRNTSSQQTAEFDPARMMLIDPLTGAHFGLADLPPLGEQLAQPVDLKPGQSYEAMMTFVVPQADQRLELKLLGTDNNQQALWELPG